MPNPSPNPNPDLVEHIASGVEGSVPRPAACGGDAACRGQLAEQEEVGEDGEARRPRRAQPVPRRAPLDLLRHE